MKYQGFIQSKKKLSWELLKGVNMSECKIKNEAVLKNANILLEKYGITIQSRQLKAAIIAIIDAVNMHDEMMNVSPKKREFCKGCSLPGIELRIDELIKRYTEQSDNCSYIRTLSVIEELKKIKAKQETSN